MGSRVNAVPAFDQVITLVNPRTDPVLTPEPELYSFPDEGNTVRMGDLFELFEMQMEITLPKTILSNALRQARCKIRRRLRLWEGRGKNHSWLFRINQINRPCSWGVQPVGKCDVQHRLPIRQK